MIAFTVPGKPVPQGSKRWLPEGRMIEANHSDLRPWRATITAYAKQAMRDSDTGFPVRDPVQVHMTFYFARPKAHYGTGRNAGTVKGSAPVLHSHQPDLDKLIRAVNDGITDAGLWADDCQVATLICSKQYAEQPSVSIEVIPL